MDVLDGRTLSETQSGLPWERHNRLEYVRTLDSPLGKLFNGQSDKFAVPGGKEESSGRRAGTRSSKKKCFVCFEVFICGVVYAIFSMFYCCRSLAVVHVAGERKTLQCLTLRNALGMTISGRLLSFPCVVVCELTAPH